MLDRFHTDVEVGRAGRQAAAIAIEPGQRFPPAAAEGVEDVQAEGAAEGIQGSAVGGGHTSQL